MQNPEDRRDAARAYIEQVGAPYTAFGMASAIRRLRALEAPDNVSVAGAVLAITAAAP
jgi:hypothetical protein